ncbi:creatinine amidohydrolase [Nocardia kruczakiae]|uniref:Creatinine amidohydrolase n=1 Tax=Nocardia kruczakiae TaxID=261477 RepID=A0ABU1XMI2_9NOCA|nr:creatininase family protein [Nocardia kruczakiae]MDR7171766.1 creatinine amidohydrolase [Nocardia kruczakiae]
MDLITTTTSNDEARRGATVAALPIGSFEQHGEHLPLMTDTAIACIVAKRLADAYDLFLLPPITISCSHEHEGFAGTVSISAKTLMAIIDDIRESLRRSHGITKLVLVNGHGGNHVLANVAVQANISEPCVALYPGKDEWTSARRCAEMNTNHHDDMHGGELETSLLLHARPDLVGDTWRNADHDAIDRPHLVLTGMAGYTTSGVIGRPSQATPAKGEAALDSLVTTFADHIKILTQ